MTDKCNVCSVEFSLRDEGGINGFFGAIPVTFCPTCLACMVDMAEQLSDYYEEAGEDDQVH